MRPSQRGLAVLLTSAHQLERRTLTRDDQQADAPAHVDPQRRIDDRLAGLEDALEELFALKGRNPPRQLFGLDREHVELRFDALQPVERRPEALRASATPAGSVLPSVGAGPSEVICWRPRLIRALSRFSH